MNLNGENLNENQGQLLPEEESERKESKEKVSNVEISKLFWNHLETIFRSRDHGVLGPVGIRVEEKMYALEQKIYEEAFNSSNLD